MIFKNWLKNRLNEARYDVSLDNYNIEVFDNQEFIEPSADPMTIMVVIKKLTSEKIYAALTEPIQLMILSEENSNDAAITILTKFAQKYNWYSLTEGTTNYKMQFSNPQVLNSFNGVGAGQRSVLFISGTIYTLEGLADVKDFKIDNESINIITFTLGYGMSGDTQAFPQLSATDLRLFAETVKSVQTLQITLTTPCVSTTFLNNLTPILAGTSTGNRTFTLTFTFNGVAFSIDTKVISATITTAPNSVPSLQLAFSR